jgi:hypothetical protein
MKVTKSTPAEVLALAERVAEAERKLWEFVP